MKGMKAVVVGMGALLVIGFVVVVVTIVDRLSRPAPEIAGEIAVTVPEDCELADAWSDEGRLYLRYDGGLACQQVIVLDAGEGRIVARFVTEAAAD